MSLNERSVAGSELSQRLIEVVMPVLDREPTDLAIEAMAAAMIVVLQVAGADHADQVEFVRRYKVALDQCVSAAKPTC